MVITSGGIYGFLSGAFAETNTQSQFLDKQIQIIDAKRTRFIEERNDLKLTISNLTTSLANPTMIQYVDSASGQLVTTTSSRQRNLLKSQLNAAKSDINKVTDSIAVLDITVLNAQINNESARELGPLKYMSELTGKPMGQIVNWFMLLIIFVFDPLAIAMVVAANMAFAQIKVFKPKEDKKDYKVYKKNEDTKEEDIIVTPKIEEKIKEEPKVIIKEIPIEKIVEKEVIKYKDNPLLNHPRVKDAIKHAKRAGELK